MHYIDIGNELHDKGVVASVKAFTDAAKNDPRSKSIQPGSYKLRSHMSAKSALALLLDSLGEASLSNKSGQYSQPTSKTISAALATFSGSTPASGSQSRLKAIASGSSDSVGSP